jgi:hypothetical protein
MLLPPDPRQLKIGRPAHLLRHDLSRPVSTYLGLSRPKSNFLNAPGSFPRRPHGSPINGTSFRFDKETNRTLDRTVNITQEFDADDTEICLACYRFVLTT